jgi:hypothetical protein
VITTIGIDTPMATHTATAIDTNEVAVGEHKVGAIDLALGARGLAAAWE